MDAGALSRGSDAVWQLVVLLGPPAVTTARHVIDGLHEVRVGRGATAVERDPRARVLRLALPDRAMSRDHARLLRIRDRWVIEDVGAKNGTKVGGAAVTRAAILDGDVLELGSTLFLFRLGPVARPDLPDLGQGTAAGAPLGLATFSGAFAAPLERLARVSHTALPVAISGASGTGKEVVARALHAASGRRGAFLAVNGGAIPQPLVESILFGHRRGSFSGATEDQPGLVRAARGGTLFLDELGDVPAAAQVALLRVLQDGEVLGVGETRAQRVDVRIVVAAQETLAELVERGRIRADLAARLDGLEVRLPPLAERREDLGLLVAALLPAGAELSLAAARALLRYHWPLNVRELEKALAVAAALAHGAPIGVDHLPEKLAVRAGNAELDDRLRTEIVALLEQHRGNVAEVARIMGKARTQVHRWVKRYGLELDSFRR